MDKKQLRKELLSLRNRLSKAEVSAKSKLICSSILRSDAYLNAEVVFAYLAFGNEVNIDGVIADALKRGKTVCVPDITGKHTMQAVSISGLENLQTGAYGIRAAGREAPVVASESIELVLTPGVGFDLRGGRIGMGAGFYDGFLAGCEKAVKIGVTYDILLREKIICEQHDIFMDYIITESLAAECSRFR